jgi:hypothetical protein
MRILSTPVETETKSDVQNENKQVGTRVTSSLLCASHIKLQDLNLISIFIARANVSYVHPVQTSPGGNAAGA